MVENGSFLSRCFSMQSPRMWTLKPWEKDATNDQGQTNKQIELSNPKIGAPKTSSLQTACFTKTVKQPSPNHCNCHHLRTLYFMPVSILELYIPLHIGFTFNISTDSTFCYKQIPPFRNTCGFFTHFDSLQTPFRLEVPAAMWPNGIDPVAQIHSRPSFWNEFAGQKIVTDGGPGPVFLSRMGSLH